MTKKLALLIATIQIIINYFGFAPRAFAEEVNLISNPSAETPGSDPTKPLNWSTGRWGTNTAVFSYKSDGQDGSRSLNVEITSYTTGDAKWYFTPVSVEPNTKYSISSWYKSSVKSDFDIQITYADGTIGYKWLGQLPASSEWKNVSYTYTTPANVKKISVFHIINSVGYLQTDNFSLIRGSNPVPVTNGIPNGSFEQSTNNMPTGWSTDSWLDNDATFTYLNEGQEGAHSTKVEITRYVSGDSKWIYDPQPIKANTYYSFSDFYKSDIESEIDAEILNSDGSTDYLTLGRVGAAGNWTSFKTTFKTSALAKSINIFHTIFGLGYLITDSYSLSETAPTSNGFNRGLISVSFDDGWKSIYDNGFPLMKKHSLPGTLYLVTDYLNTSNHMTTANVQEMQQAGFEAGSHTVSHPHLATLSLANLTTQLSNSKSLLEPQFGPITSIASPYGEYNDTVISNIKKYYASHRTTDGGLNTKSDFDQYRIKATSIKNTDNIDTINKMIKDAIDTKSWVVLTFHLVDNSGDTYSTTPEKLDSYLTAIQNSGLPVVTIDQAIAEITPQLGK